MLSCVIIEQHNWSQTIKCSWKKKTKYNGECLSHHKKLLTSNKTFVTLNWHIIILNKFSSFLNPKWFPTENMSNKYIPLFMPYSSLSCSLIFIIIFIFCIVNSSEVPAQWHLADVWCLVNGACVQLSTGWMHSVYMVDDITLTAVGFLTDRTLW